MLTEQEKLEAAWLDGFMSSAEGYNGEYPFYGEPTPDLLERVKAEVAALFPAVTSPPKGEEEPSDEAKLLAYEHAHETAIELGYPSITEALEAARPNPVSAELVEAGKAVEAAITAFANMALLAVPADHNPTVRAVLGEGLYNARERLRAALSAHAGGTV